MQTWHARHFMAVRSGKRQWQSCALASVLRARTRPVHLLSYGNDGGWHLVNALTTRLAGSTILCWCTFVSLHFIHTLQHFTHCSARQQHNRPVVAQKYIFLRGCTIFVVFENRLLHINTHQCHLVIMGIVLNVFIFYMSSVSFRRRLISLFTSSRRESSNEQLRRSEGNQWWEITYTWTCNCPDYQWRVFFSVVLNRWRRFSNWREEMKDSQWWSRHEIEGVHDSRSHIYTRDCLCLWCKWTSILLN
jgi:hypothetical protein